MKKLLLLFLIITQISFSQNEITFKINHMLGNTVFSAGTKSTNDLSITYTFSRLQYYVSDINIVHDGGTVTSIDSTWILVSALENTEIVLGDYDITNLESVNFKIGVEQDINYNDPSLWAVDHPLSPKSPSMHWGWTGGYRFIAMEGETAGNIFELHIVGDDNYKQVDIDFTDISAQNNKMTIDIKADYNQAVSGLDVSDLSLHADSGPEVDQGVSNFKNKVFSQKTEEAEPAPTAIAYAEKSLLNIYPNPTKGKIYFDNTNFDKLTVTNTLGIVVKKVAKAKEILLEEKGLYFLNFYSKENQLISIQKVVVQ